MCVNQYIFQDAPGQIVRKPSNRAKFGYGPVQIPTQLSCMGQIQVIVMYINYLRFSYLTIFNEFYKAKLV